jgi:DNA polymerase III subunit delta'
MHWLDVQGQLRAMRMLQMAFAGRRMPHAWLFYGPSGAGKEMLAVRFARLLLCEKPVTLDPPSEAGTPGSWHDGCGQCKSCRLVESSLKADPQKSAVHPDLHMIYRGLNEFHPDSTVKNRKALDISVDVIRYFLLDPVRGRSAMGKAKIYIVRESELLSTAAQNALLKTLEEPPADTYLILLSTARDRLLPTTNSRCQPVSFGTLDVSVASRIIAGVGVRPDDASFYAALSEGRPGWALYLAKMDLRQDYLAIAEGLGRIGAADPTQAGAAWNEMAQRWAKTLQDQASEADPTTDQNRQSLQVLFVIANAILRDALRLGAGAATEPVLPDSVPSLRLAAGWGDQALAAAIKQVAWAESAIARNANTVLTLEALAVKLAQCSRGGIAGSASPLAREPAA